MPARTNPRRQRRAAKPRLADLDDDMDDCDIADDRADDDTNLELAATDPNVGKTMFLRRRIEERWEQRMLQTELEDFETYLV